MKNLVFLTIILLTISCNTAQSVVQTTSTAPVMESYNPNTANNTNCYWQQKADYNMKIDFDVNTNQFKGKQTLIYTNNSPDTLRKVYYHLYFNAFQPNSMMDIRSRSIKDPDRRVGDRISKLTDNEIGYQNVLKLLQNNKQVTTEVNGTLLMVELNEPLLPGTTHTFQMDFEAQVPKQIRRSGRDNKENIRYSMTQWYPKIAEYDQMGWHAYEYVGREFHSPWGDYDVAITIDGNYVLGGTGVLQENATTYSNFKPSKTAKTWHFKQNNIIDFAWAADPNYTHHQVQVPNGPLVHYLYNKETANIASWKKMIDEYTIPLFSTMSEQFGHYPYSVYSVIQGGDGGMEYPLATLITGDRKFESLYGVISHELAHSWFQMMLASNEALYAWMDEGMTSFADAVVTEKVMNESGNEFSSAIKSYTALVESGYNEPANQHSDHFNTNYAYSISAYVKGSLLLAQLRYIMGEDVFYKAMKRYFHEWKFKHPTPNDFIRVMEKESGMQLHWFLREWINTTRTIDYAIESVSASTTEAVSVVTLKNNGLIPMPVEVTIEFNDGRPNEVAYIPTNLTLGSKEITAKNWSEKPQWNWVSNEYQLMVLAPLSAIKSVTIDKNQQTADIQPSNNTWND